MEQKPNTSHPPNTNSDKEIIKKILSEKESDASAKDKMYRILYEASSVDNVNMDTDLIDECVKTIDLLEGNEEHLSEEKMKEMQQNIDQKFKEWQNTQHRKSIKKKIIQIAACFIFIFFTTSVVASAFGHNFINLAIDWGKETFHFSSQDQSKLPNNGDNVSERIINHDIEMIFADIQPRPSLPEWLPEDFVFKYAEKFNRIGSTNIILYYEHDTNDKIIIFDFDIYMDNKLPEIDTAFEKDENLVEIYERNSIEHYILKNIDQVQAVWSNFNIVYHVSGDVLVEEMEKIIDSLYGG